MRRTGSHPRIEDVIGIIVTLILLYSLALFAVAYKSKVHRVANLERTRSALAAFRARDEGKTFQELLQLEYSLATERP